MLKKMKELKANKKNQPSPEEAQKQRREKTAQQWIPIADIDGSIAYRKDNVLLGALKVQPININLLSDAERRRKVESLAEEINGETEGFQIFCIGRPVDLNNYLDWLQDKAKQEQDFIRKQVLKGYIRQASRIASSGEITERRFYIIITKKNEPKAEEELMSRLEDIKIKFSQAELQSHICSDDELLDVNTLFANPAQAAYERVVSEHVLAPILAELG